MSDDRAAGGVPTSASHQADAARRRRLRWRSRRGLLENDLILTRFLDRYEQELTDDDVGALDRLLDCNDNELMDLILGRSEPEGELATGPVLELVRRLRDV
ncbi:succinate dehydrogenase assembly factor 2 [Paraburkholderia sp.]|uniref:succinate dehydrogenase assembly factor 2 n=1 Tax=Paraburkholderia sp. TaxID=1926495 RepID=UPI0039E5B4D8